MLKYIKIFSLGIFLFVIPNSIVAKEEIKHIKLEVNKSFDPDKIKSLTNNEELHDLLIKIKGVEDSDVSYYSFSGSNFTEVLVEKTKSYNQETGEIEFNLAPLSGVLEENPPPDSMLRYKILYSGNNKPAIFGSDNYIELELHVVRYTEQVVSTSNKGYGPMEVQEAALNFVMNKTDHEKYYSSKTNLFVKDNTVHIYVDQNGNLIETGIPTTAKENYLYQVHLLVDENSPQELAFNFIYDGKYQPKFNIEKTNDIIRLNADEEKNTPIIKEITFARIGPFTDEFSIKLEKSIKVNGAKEIKTILDNKIQIAKLYHVSVSTGLVGTTLRNPQNIEKMQMENGDITLIADDPSIRGVLTIMATYYPKGRSFLFLPSGGVFDLSRIGIQVGAQLSESLSENFFLGLSHDFARGGSISYGAHFGRRNYIAGKSNFNFGSEKFDLPELNVKKEWGVGFYFGVVIDTRVAVELFKVN